MRLKFATITALLMLAVPAFGQTIRQQISCAGVSPCGNAWPSNVQAGNAIVVLIETLPTSGTANGFAFTDNDSNVYEQGSLVFSSTAGLFGPVTLAMFYACNIANTPNPKPLTSVTVSGPSAGPNWIELELSNVQAVSGTGCFDQGSSSQGSSTGTFSGPSITPTFLSSLVISGMSTANVSPSPNSGWSNLTFDYAEGVGVYQDYVSLSPIAVTWTYSGGSTQTWVGVIGNFPNSVQPSSRKLRVTQDAKLIVPLKGDLNENQTGKDYLDDWVFVGSDRAFCRRSFISIKANIDEASAEEARLEGKGYNAFRHAYLDSGRCPFWCHLSGGGRDVNSNYLQRSVSRGGFWR